MSVTIVNLNLEMVAAAKNFSTCGTRILSQSQLHRQQFEAGMGSKTVCLKIARAPPITTKNKKQKFLCFLVVFSESIIIQFALTTNIALS